MVSNGHRDTGTHQQHGIEQRQAPRADDFLGWRKEFRVRIVQQRPGEFKRWPQHVSDAFGAFTAQCRARDVAHIKQRTEKKAMKNITSEKMNQLMPQRNERSICALYNPWRLSLITVPNQPNSM